MKMGLERGLKERIPEIQEVVQAMPEVSTILLTYIQLEALRLSTVHFEEGPIFRSLTHSFFLAAARICCSVSFVHNDDGVYFLKGPPLNEEQIDVVLDGVRPFLQVAGGSIETNRIEGVDGLQPTIWLEMKGNSASLNSVKLEIAQRLQRHFMMAGLRVEWVG